MFSCIKSVSCVCISLIRVLSIKSKYPSAISLHFKLATPTKLKLKQPHVIWQLSSCLPILTHILCLKNLYKISNDVVRGHFNRPRCMMEAMRKVHSLLVSSVQWLLCLLKKAKLNVYPRLTQTSFFFDMFIFRLMHMHSSQTPCPSSLIFAY